MGRADRPDVRIALATDFADGSAGLFSTALGLALAARERGRVDLHVLHVGPVQDWRHQPRVRDQLVRWGVLPADAGLDAFHQLGVHVRPVPLPADGGEVRDVLLGEIDLVDPTLVVLGTHGHVGLERLLQPAVAEPVARRALVPALIVRTGGERLVDPASGAVRLRRVLVPIDTRSPMQPVVDALTGLVGALGASPVSFKFVHVGGASGLPDLRLPERTDWMWSTERLGGVGVVEGILAAAVAIEADLVAMGTAGHDTILDALRGSRTERVVRRAPCPVLALPLPPAP